MFWNRPPSVWSPKAERKPAISKRRPGISSQKELAAFLLLIAVHRLLMPDDCFLLAEPLGEQMQFGLAIAERLERTDGFEHIIAIRTGLAVALPHVMHALGNRQPPGILDVAAVDGVAQRP